MRMSRYIGTPQPQKLTEMKVVNCREIGEKSLGVILHKEQSMKTHLKFRRKFRPIFRPASRPPKKLVAAISLWGISGISYTVQLCCRRAKLNCRCYIPAHPTKKALSHFKSSAPKRPRHTGGCLLTLKTVTSLSY